MIFVSGSRKKLTLPARQILMALVSPQTSEAILYRYTLNYLNPNRLAKCVALLWFKAGCMAEKKLQAAKLTDDPK